MEAVNRCLHLSATAVTAFKCCPTRFRYGYIEGLRQAEDTESQRIGTNWHALHEEYRNQRKAADHDQSFAAALESLQSKYARVPDGFDAFDWEIERTILSVSFAAHCWYYQSDEAKTLACEVGFKLPLYHPRTMMPLPQSDVIRIGKIDRLVQYNGNVSIADYKSTSKPIAPDSEFWNHLHLDSQISMYVMAGKELAAAGLLEEYGIPKGTPVAGAFYDVWHKPTIRPSKLTQAETKALMETGKYCGSDFKAEITHEWNEVTTDEKGEEITISHKRVSVDGMETPIDMGKKGFAIRETPAMFGARLLQDIVSRPEFYFARREIARTDKDVKRFRGQLYAIYQSMKAARDGGHWVENEHQCNATFRCPYTGICWHGVDVTNGHTPAGMKRIFADLTVGGEHVEL